MIRSLLFPNVRIHLSQGFAKGFCAIALAGILVMGGCGEKEKASITGPIEGKRLDGTETASNNKPETGTGEVTPPVNPPDASASPETVVALTPEQEKVKREEWRDKKTGKPDVDDLIAKANMELRPSLGEIAKGNDSKTKAGTPATTTDPASTIADDPTKLAKPLKDPTAEIPFVDPNNPDFIPADRNLWKQFDPSKLRIVDGHMVVPFADLSGFPYSGMVGAPEPAADAKDAKDEPKEPVHVIPDAIKSLDKKQVMIAGYMMPIDFENGGTNEFVLTRQIPSCFYCVPPQLNDWVEVKMKDGKRVPYVPDGMIELYGTLEVGEMKEDGFIVNMYRMTGVKMVEAKQN